MINCVKTPVKIIGVLLASLASVVSFMGLFLSCLAWDGSEVFRSIAWAVALAISLFCASLLSGVTIKKGIISIVFGMALLMGGVAASVFLSIILMFYVAATTHLFMNPFIFPLSVFISMWIFSKKLRSKEMGSHFPHRSIRERGKRLFFFTIKWVMALGISFLFSFGVSAISSIPYFIKMSNPPSWSTTLVSGACGIFLGAYLGRALWKKI
jgi:hypothetical protein